MTRSLTRRALMQRSAWLGCCAAASPLMTPVSLAAAPWDTRIVVIILRGAMDGLDLLRPYGAPELTSLRGSLIQGEAGQQDLDGFYALHPAMSPLRSLWDSGELGFVQAVSTPYRNRRSHFDGQDLLEAGTATLGMGGDGWLNRMLQQIPGTSPTTAFSIGRGDMKVLLGAAEAADWTPEAALKMSPQALRLAELMMEDDPMFHAALSEAILLSERGDAMLEDADASMMTEVRNIMRGQAHVGIAEFAAAQLRADTRVVAFSQIGWDTHNKQVRNIQRSFERLSETLLTLKAASGPVVWGKTAVLAMTEFGRTAAANGTGGTDHGTGGTMLLAGGAIRGGRVYGRWPGLDEAALFKRRDLMPTSDVRATAAWVLRAATGLDRGTLERVVFPGLDMGDDPGVIL